MINNEFTYLCCGFTPNNHTEDDPRKNGCKWVTINVKLNFIVMHHLFHSF